MRSGHQVILQILDCSTPMITQVVSLFKSPPQSLQYNCWQLIFSGEFSNSSKVKNEVGCTQTSQTLGAEQLLSHTKPNQVTLCMLMCQHPRSLHRLGALVRKVRAFQIKHNAGSAGRDWLKDLFLKPRYTCHIQGVARSKLMFTCAQPRLARFIQHWCIKASECQIPGGVKVVEGRRDSKIQDLWVTNFHLVWWQLSFLIYEQFPISLYHHYMAAYIYKTVLYTWSN